jgi:hypothetical protein
MYEYLEQSAVAVSEIVKRDITENLRQLHSSFGEQFPPNNNDNNWLINPFIGSFQTEGFSGKGSEDLIDIVSALVLKQTFPLFLFQVFVRA